MQYKKPDTIGLPNRQTLYALCKFGVNLEIFYTNRRKSILLSSLIIATAIRFIIVFTHGDATLVNEWDPIVRNLLAGRGFVYYSIDAFGGIVAEFQISPVNVIPSAYMPPLYALFLTSITYFTGIGFWGIKIILIIQTAISAVTLLIIYETTKLKFDSGAGLIAVLILAFYPLMAYMPSQISAVNLYLFLNYMLIYLLVKWELYQNIEYIVISGILSGLLVLSRPEFILYLFVISKWIYGKQKNRNRNMIIYLLIIGGCIAPWLTRNYLIYERIMPTTTSAGINLWEGFNKNATGILSSYANPVVKMNPQMKKAIHELKPSKYYEVELDRIYRENAIKDLREYPYRAFWLTVKKFVYFWGYYWGIECSYPGVKSVLYWLPWFLQMPFFLYGIFLVKNRFKDLSLFYNYLLIATIVVMLFFVVPRYRLFILPIVIMFSSYGIKGLYNFIITKSKNTKEMKDAQAT